jgi:hypothetical protein
MRILNRMKIILAILLSIFTLTGCVIVPVYSDGYPYYTVTPQVTVDIPIYSTPVYRRYDYYPRYYSNPRRLYNYRYNRHYRIYH